MSPGGRREAARELAIEVVCRPGVAAGFELAGLAARTAEDPEEARVAVLEMAEDPDVGVIAVEEELVADPVELEEEIRRAGGATLLPFPGPTWVERPEAPREYVARILRRAIGYRVRI
ncbi:MAG: ATPase [Gemmatimonadetes bacterium]|nr:ATPase [Gemmatimonadota bacterium]NIR77236.1 ATPase [Gemmatimonadota bacterium]NIT85755.1 ATPase [Gemmatimonadota bacterium]NIU29580.1 ATPase [Gemmatimonadota bacterium]NIU34629.1 ATPase [Gemmatimonadota bacterium]